MHLITRQDLQKSPALTPFSNYPSLVDKTKANAEILDHSATQGLD